MLASIWDTVIGVFGVSNLVDNGHYFGLPSFFGRNKRKEIVIKMIVLALPVYCISVFLLPPTFCNYL
ncbi:hypothetical protein EPI10_027853 [Gossypium australe]|uniref:Uncharacterized protein n=1 Tax=Gossypium australe TaxID=47621 RepID=A0A5B6UT38_9ROSI|nr:hypothetical protein EPI10_027853 [Gossypium australe]